VSVRESKMKNIYTIATAAKMLAGSLVLSLSLAAQADNNIEEVLVSASLLPISATRSANAITVIDSEQLKNRAAISVSDLLRDIPGLAVSRSGVQGSQTQIRVRGAEANHLLVLIDGVEANDPSQSDELNWGTLTTSDIERVEVIRGPQSAMRGSDAMAGVVNIITRSADQPFSAKVFAEAGSFSTNKLGLNVGHKAEKYDVSLGVTELESKGDNIILNTGTNDNDGYKNTSINFKAGVDASDELRLTLSLSQSDGFSEYDDEYAAKIGTDFHNEFNDLLHSDFDRFSSRVNAQYASADGKWNHKISLSESQFENNNFKYTSDGVVVANGATESKRQDYQYIGSRLWEAFDQQVSLLLERETEEYKQSGGWAMGNDANKVVDRDTDSIALEYRVDPVDKLTLAVGARRDNNDTFEDANTWKLEGVYRLDDSTRFRAASGTAIKNPTFSELYGIFSGFESNPDLAAEQSQSWELGIDKDLLDKRLEIKATYFNAKLDNEISSKCIRGCTDDDWSNDIYQPYNISGISRQQGLELASSWFVNESVVMDASYTYTDSTQNGVDEIRRARHLGSLNLRWRVQDNLTINANAQHNGTQTDLYGVILDAFTLVNVNANFNATDKLDLYLRLDNLFDEDYQEVSGYQTLGFGASLGLRYSL
jgi:vitamin B12 transporter